MKLLRDFFRLRLAGLRGASFRGTAAPYDFRVTVPAPLDRPSDRDAVVVDLPRAHVPPMRREPASFLKTPRHRRLGASR
ncbi:hypothetical protein ACPPVV_17520 [Rhodanobacter sp. Col0626]|uniref:hypothetical protein n=1 Tax=Rhodanobacter sp. Col0626 TaxID=3415679 RepID=UPI003CEDCE1D